ncbi:MAG: single-stranded-DNA-specific exonuclease RecJ [Woeseiaceae bacterium]
MNQLRDLVERPTTPHELTDVDPVVAKILAARGVKTRTEMDISLARLAPVSQMANIDRAVELLIQHRDGRVLIVGDFDADGATSTALMWRCLERLGFSNIDSLVPNRFDFGYGLSPPLVEVAKANMPTLIVTVDNGISSVDGVATARQYGIDVLITDHHLPPDVMPDANVILNPNQPDDPYPSKHLAGVGVAFCLMAALARKLAKNDPGIAKIPADYLDLVALGTVADVVPLDQNNRILVEAGLQRIRAGRCSPGITALLNVAGRDPARIVATDLGFAVGPRLNAAGRLEDMSVGIRCLMAETMTEANAAAVELDRINRERRTIQSDMQRDASAALETIMQDQVPGLPDCLSMYQPHWHQGVVGLIASGIKERTGRPAFAFAHEDSGLLKGSGRSIPGVHLRDLLAEVDRQLPGAIEKFGGHAMAAGLTLVADQFEAFSAAAERAMAQLFPAADFLPVIMTDGALPADCFDIEFANRLRTIMPWGQRFPEPAFMGDFDVSDVRIVGEKHLKMQVQVDGQTVDAIAFGQVRDPLPERGSQISLCYRLDVNVWRGVSRLQLVVEQWRVVGE